MRKKKLNKILKNIKNVTCRVDSIESFGAADGPGIRFILFLQGCKLRCLYCHNPESWKMKGGEEWSLKKILKTITSYGDFYDKGGVTISGGEPLLQYGFLYQLLIILKKLDYHTAIDTSGVVKLKYSQKCIDIADMLLLDIKEVDENDCLRLTGLGLVNTLKTLEYCQSIQKDVWIRYVCVPNLTLKSEKIHKLAQMLQDKSCIKKVQLLPFHQLAKHKYEELGLFYALKNEKTPNKEQMNEANEILKIYNLPV